jgi:hypothetical protein
MGKVDSGSRLTWDELRKALDKLQNDAEEIRRKHEPVEGDDDGTMYLVDLDCLSRSWMVTGLSTHKQALVMEPDAYSKVSKLAMESVGQIHETSGAPELYGIPVYVINPLPAPAPRKLPWWQRWWWGMWRWVEKRNARQ